MTPKAKGRRKNAPSGVAQQQQQQQQQHQTSQYQYQQPQQYDEAPYHTQFDGSHDLVYDPAALVASVQSALDNSNEHLNISVLRRYEPDVLSIISTAPYAVLYVFVQEDQTWEKSGIEGTLFVTACTPDAQGAERFRVIVLNRRGLDNFSSELSSPEDVDVTEEYIIIKGDVSEAEHDPDYNDEGPQIYGLWIFSEPPPSSTAQMRDFIGQIIVQCADRAAESRKLIAEHQTAQLAQELANSQTSPGVMDSAGADTQRQLSLLELFGRSRAQDSGSITNNHYTATHVPFSGPPPVQGIPAPQTAKAMFTTNSDTEFFRTGTTPNPRPPQSNGSHTGMGGTSINVSDLFKPQK